MLEFLKNLMSQTIEKIAEDTVFIRNGRDDYRIVVEQEGIRFERYLQPTNARETLQIVENSLRANAKKRERVWRAELPSRDSGYAMFYIKI